MRLGRVADGPVRTICRIGVDNFRAIREQNSLALDRNILRHAQRDRKSLRRADHGISNASVSAGGIEENFAVGKFSSTASLSHDVPRGAVFDRSARVAPFGFTENLDVRELAPDALQTQQWRV